jgi:signal peptidase I
MFLNLENKNEDASLENKDNSNFKKELISFLKDLIIIIFIVFVIRTFFVLPFQISGQSMYDSYYDKEFIIVNRFEYLKFPLV